jgi:hypothetical protein
MAVLVDDEADASAAAADWCLPAWATVGFLEGLFG